MGRERNKHNRVFPELTLFDTVQEGRAAQRRAMLKTVKTGRFWVGVIVTALAGTGLGLAILQLAPVPPNFRGAVVGFVAGGLAGGSYAWICRRAIQRSLRQQLIDLGKPVCLHCGYDLRGQEKARCPECGNQFDAKLLTPRPSEDAHRGER